MIARAIAIFLVTLTAFLFLMWLDERATLTQESDYIIGTPIEDPPQDYTP